MGINYLTLKKSIKAVVTYLWIIACLAMFIVLMAASLVLSANLDSYTRLAERHGDDPYSFDTEIDTIDKISYYAINFKVIAIENILKGRKREHIIYYLNKIDEKTMYEFAALHERPELKYIFLHCKLVNSPSLCYQAFLEYDKLYAKGIVNSASFDIFLSHAVSENDRALEKIKREAEQQRMEEEKRLEAENRKTKLYSCIENDDGLICKKVKE
ncbi:hypothetical protein [Pseudomonas sp. HY7a-MNA-CIBAN-0227]|uniref:hypothetical protein n=1 Tax=Pseudomonas sp. HY7a-MNA-CIBAN-0227 TaxID=3140474 RepID=UPI00331AC326